MINKLILVGRLGNDPETGSTSNNNDYCSFSVATTETWNDKSGNKQERTTWHRVKVWGNTAVACGQYLKKGSMVYVEGVQHHREYDKDGEKRYAAEVDGKAIKFLSPRDESVNNSQGKSALDSQSREGLQSRQEYTADDIPF